MNDKLAGGARGERAVKPMISLVVGGGCDAVTIVANKMKWVIFSRSASREMGFTVEDELAQFSGQGFAISAFVRLTLPS